MQQKANVAKAFATIRAEFFAVTFYCEVPRQQRDAQHFGEGEGGHRIAQARQPQGGQGDQNRGQRAHHHAQQQRRHQVPMRKHCG